jgi:hypothetical protein
MSFAAQPIILRVAGLLQDATGVSWETAELVRWLNDGALEVVMQRPDANVVYETLALGTNGQQDLNALGCTRTPIKLIEVLRSTSTQSAVRLVDRALMDAQRPRWRAATASADTTEYMFDARTPTRFWVYPPPATGASVELAYSAQPVAIAEPSAGAGYSSVTGEVELPVSFANALVDYVMYRAHSKDSQDANASRALAHYGAFTAALGAELKATAGVAPHASTSGSA